MLSRVAEAVYWMSRYVERAENVARVIDVNLHLMLDLPSGLPELWQPVVRTTGDEEAFAARYATLSREHVVRFLSFDQTNPNSILACLRTARENARSVREVISSEMWEQVNTFFLMVSAAAVKDDALHSPHDFFTAVKQSSHLFEGLTSATMSHGEGWHFCRMGRLLERADKTSRILDMTNLLALPAASSLPPQLDTLQWAAVLRSISAFEMYRKRYHNLVPAQIVEFLLLNQHFPRSVHHCVTKVDESLHTLSGAPPATFRNPAEQRLGRLRAELAYSEVQDILDHGLHEFLDTLQTKLNRVGDGIYDTFFALRPIGGALAEEAASG